MAISWVPGFQTPMPACIPDYAHTAPPQCRCSPAFSTYLRMAGLKRGAGERRVGGQHICGYRAPLASSHQCQVQPYNARPTCHCSSLSAISTPFSSDAPLVSMMRPYSWVQGRGSGWPSVSGTWQPAELSYASATAGSPPTVNPYDGSRQPHLDRAPGGGGLRVGQQNRGD